jgi:hypothetical protein
MPRLHDAAAWRHHGMGGLIADSHCSRWSHDSSRILRADHEWNRIQHGHVAASLAIASGSTPEYASPTVTRHHGHTVARSSVGDRHESAGSWTSRAAARLCCSPWPRRSMEFGEGTILSSFARLS